MKFTKLKYENVDDHTDNGEDDEDRKHGNDGEDSGENNDEARMV